MRIVGENGLTSGARIFGAHCVTDYGLEGALAKGGAWGRGNDSAGIAVYLNGLRAPHRDYLAAGGLGFFLGDGRLNYGSENIFETYYGLGIVKGAWASLGYQRIANPGYNRDRGPANFLGLRFHAEI